MGPNGSGKSNVIDAMLFVFGKRAKKLRLNKVSELIHNSSSSSNEKLPCARVSVFMQEIMDVDSNARLNSDNRNRNEENEDAKTGEEGDKSNHNDDDDNAYEVVPNSQVTLTRIARRDNTSTYKLNNKTVSFKQLATYLKQKGIDLENNRFLILQGEVEMISMMPPKAPHNDNNTTAADGGLLEYLEDIIGSNQYITKTQEASEVLEQCNNQRMEKLHRVKAMEKEKDALEGAKLEAEGLLQKESALRQKRHVLWQIQRAAVKQKHETVATENQELQQRLEEKRTALSQAATQLNELEQKYAQEKAECEELHAATIHAKGQFTAYERRDIQLREDLKFSKSNLKKMQKKITTIEKKVQDANEKARQITDSQEELQTSLTASIKQKALEEEKLDEIYASRNEATKELRITLELRKQEVAPLQREAAAKRTVYETACTEHQLLTDSMQAAKLEYESALAAYQELDVQQVSKQKDLVALEEEFAASKLRIVEAKQELQEIVQEEKALQEESTRVVGHMEKLKSSSNATNFNSSHKRNNYISPTTIKILHSLQSCSSLKQKILGRLGDLASIDAQYDIAISTACGNALNHIVVRTTNDAKGCLRHLRQHNLGRANFLPLDKLKKGAHDLSVRTPEDAPRLYDQINPLRADIAPALFSVVSNTLVAPDLNTASRWAYEYGKRWRVVTLDGKLIEMSGAMSGGGGKGSVKCGGMRLMSDEEDANSSKQQQQLVYNQAQVQEAEKQALMREQKVRSLQEQSQKITHRIAQCRTHKLDLNKEIKTLERRIRTLEESSIPKLQMELRNLKSSRDNYNSMETGLPMLKSKCVTSDEDQARLQVLQVNMNDARAQMQEFDEKLQSEEEKVSAIQHEILNAGGQALKNQISAVENAKQEAEHASTKFNEAMVSMQALKKALDKLFRNKVTTEEELNTLQTQLQEKTEEYKALEGEAFSVMEAFERCKEEELRKEKELLTYRKEADVCSKTLSKEKATEVELCGNADECLRKLRDLESQIEHCNREMDKLEAEEVRTCHEYEMEDENEDDGNDGVTLTPKLKILDVSVLLSKYDKSDLKNSIEVLERERDTLAKNANMSAIAEYRKKEADYFAR